MTIQTQQPGNAGSAPKAPASSQHADLRWLWSPGIGLVILGLVATVPLFGDFSLLRIWTLILMYVILAQSWNFIGGFVGYAAFGNVAFFGIGAYVTGVMLNNGKPFLLGILAGAIVAGLFAFLFGLPVLRLKGHYFAVATLGAAEAVREFVTVRNIGGGGGGLISTPLPGLDAYPRFFFGFLGVSIFLLLLTTWIKRNRFGYALVAIRENEDAAEAMGISTYWYKVGAFVLSAIPTAIAGGLYAYWAIAFDPPTVFDSSITVEMVLLTFLGGAGTIVGPIIGAIAFEYVSFQLTLSGNTYHNTFLGLLIIFVTLFIPQGIVRLVQEFTVKPTPGMSRWQYFIEGVRRVRRFNAANGI